MDLKAAKYHLTLACHELGGNKEYTEAESELSQELLHFLLVREIPPSVACRILAYAAGTALMAELLVEEATQQGRN